MNTNTEKKTAVFTVRGKGIDTLPTREFAPTGTVDVELCRQQFLTIMNAIKDGKRIHLTHDKLDILKLEPSLKSDFKTVTLKANVSTAMSNYVSYVLRPILTSPHLMRMIDGYEIANRLNRIKAARLAKAASRKNVKCPKCGTEFSVKNG